MRRVVASPAYAFGAPRPIRKVCRLVFFSLRRGGCVWISRRLADNGFLDDPLVVLLVVLLLSSGVLAACIAHPAFVNNFGTYGVQQAAISYFTVASLAKGLVGEVARGPGTHMRRT